MSRRKTPTGRTLQLVDAAYLERLRADRDYEELFQHVRELDADEGVQGVVILAMINNGELQLYDSMENLGELCWAHDTFGDILQDLRSSSWED